MKIKLNDKLFFKTDAYNAYIVELVTSENGKKYEKAVSGYCSRFEDAVLSYIDRKIISSEATEMRQLAKEIEELKNEVREWAKKYDN